MKAAIISPWGNVPTRDSSHAAGWARLWAQQLNADIVNDESKYHEYDVHYLWNDINGEVGKINLFGCSAGSEVEGKIKNKWRVIASLGIMPINLDYCQTHGVLFTKRGMGLISEKYNHLERASQMSRALEGDRLVIGDSHALSVSRPHQACLRNDGKTLNGALNAHMIQTAVNVYRPVDLVTYFGNIDVRFHLGRQEMPIVATQDLANRYVNVLSNLPDNIRVRAVELLPNAPDDRKLPKSGLYKGEKFYGSLELRQECVNEFNNILRQSDIETIAWNGYSTPDGLLDVNLMEARQSVHIRPSAYNLGY